MTTESIMAIARRYCTKVEGAKTEAERTEIYLDFLSATAADRAATVFLAVQAEAERGASKEDHATLEQRLLATVAMAGCEYATTVGNSHQQEFAEGRREIEVFAAREFQRAFDTLLKSVRAGGSA